jgi:hypothetical protein
MAHWALVHANRHLSRSPVRVSLRVKPFYRGITIGERLLTAGQFLANRNAIYRHGQGVRVHGCHPEIVGSGC